MAYKINSPACPCKSGKTLWDCHGSEETAILNAFNRCSNFLRRPTLQAAQGISALRSARARQFIEIGTARNSKFRALVDEIIIKNLPQDAIKSTGLGQRPPDQLMPNSLDWVFPYGFESKIGGRDVFLDSGYFESRVESWSYTNKGAAVAVAVRFRSLSGAAIVVDDVRRDYVDFDERVVDAFIRSPVIAIVCANVMGHPMLLFEEKPSFLGWLFG